ncbi:hypothetical protein OIO90_004082 [Microbotryomycetes sp. JL221]|nr:hypothetical protein OIO90_004082 [Microbotryomycetes sp. JL221]
MLESRALSALFEVSAFASATGDASVNESPMDALLSLLQAAGGRQAIVKMSVYLISTAIQEVVGRELSSPHNPRSTVGMPQVGQYGEYIDHRNSSDDNDQSREASLEHLVLGLLHHLNKIEWQSTEERNQSCESKQVQAHLAKYLQECNRFDLDKPSPIKKDFAFSADHGNRPLQRSSSQSTSPILDIGAWSEAFSTLTSYPRATAASVSDFVRSGATSTVPPPVPPKPTPLSPQRHKAQPLPVHIFDEQKMDVTFDQFVSQQAESLLHLLSYESMRKPATVADAVVRILLSDNFSPFYTESTEAKALRTKCVELCLGSWWTQKVMPELLWKAALPTSVIHQSTLAPTIKLVHSRYSSGREHGRRFEPIKSTFPSWQVDIMLEPLIKAIGSTMMTAIRSDSMPLTPETPQQAHLFIREWSIYSKDLWVNDESTAKLQAINLSPGSVISIIDHLTPIVMNGRALSAMEGSHSTDSTQPTMYQRLKATRESLSSTRNAARGIALYASRQADQGNQVRIACNLDEFVSEAVTSRLETQDRTRRESDDSSDFDDQGAWSPAAASSLNCSPSAIVMDTDRSHSVTDSLQDRPSSLTRADFSIVRKGLLALVRAGCVPLESGNRSSGNLLLDQLKHWETEARSRHAFVLSVTLQQAKSVLQSLVQAGWTELKTLEFVDDVIEPYLEQQKKRQTTTEVLREMLDHVDQQRVTLIKMARSTLDDLHTLRAQLWYASIETTPNLQSVKKMIFDRFLSSRQARQKLEIQQGLLKMGLDVQIQDSEVSALEDHNRLEEILQSLAQVINNHCQPGVATFDDFWDDVEYTRDDDHHVLTSSGLIPREFATLDELSFGQHDARQDFLNGVITKLVDRAWSSFAHRLVLSPSNSGLDGSNTENDFVLVLLDQFAAHSTLSCRLDALLELELILSIERSAPQSVQTGRRQLLSTHAESGKTNAALGLGIYGVDVPQLDSPISAGEPISTDSMLLSLEEAVLYYAETEANARGRSKTEVIDSLWQNCTILSTLFGQSNGTSVLDRGPKAKAFVDMVAVLISIRQGD